MRDVYDFAKFFIKNGADSTPDTYDGNMKLQKLLVLADLASISEFGEPLFNDEILAFENGCVIEKVRLRYKNDYAGFKQESADFHPDFSENEYYILNLITDIFGNASAQELSEINHTFDFWKEALLKGTNDYGFHDKKSSVVDIMSQKGDIKRMKEVIDAFKESSYEELQKETINGVTYYFNKDFALTDEIISKLEKFSLSAEDDSYTIYLDNGNLVIY